MSICVFVGLRVTQLKKGRQKHAVMSLTWDAPGTSQMLSDWSMFSRAGNTWRDCRRNIKRQQKQCKPESNSFVRFKICFTLPVQNMWDFPPLLVNFF